ncbi:MAG: hypothetical protein K2J82_11530 [Muribaculaceae bacterium]|nr:hypothetical protein [Muribaculaceae bacterium]MDE6755227.1 hypothetical protein [Muribaculaceae bacterium]
MKACKIITTGVILLALTGGISSCGKKTESQTGGFPKDFNRKSDTEKVGYVMKNATPDSVARFVIDATLGRANGITLDSLNVAAAYAYSHYNDSSLIVYSTSFDEYSSSLPLPDKMKIYVQAGKSVPQQLGYQLGLEYVSQIRENRKTVGRVREEIAEFRRACADDTITYTRFLKGFKTALQVDQGHDLSEEIYKAFSE